MKKTIAFFSLVFITQNLWADYITQNVSNGCYDNTIGIDNNSADVYAVFTRNMHTCSPGYYLPANMDGCYACGSEQTCIGGTYSFNENISQGIERSVTDLFTQSAQNGCVADFINIDNNSADVYAVFTPNAHTCNAGYYLPANVDECTICPANSVCAGGTYTFNETIAQGIEPCPNGYFSPTGSDSVCYPHIFHVGNDVVYLKSTKQTTPSLNFRIGNDIFYANMTTVRTKMNKDSDHYFHAQWDDNHYYVCDDTICPDAE